MFFCLSPVDEEVEDAEDDGGHERGREEGVDDQAVRVPLHIGGVLPQLGHHVMVGPID